mgnify:CR=1 FL=1
MRDEYIPAFLELAKAINDKAFLKDLEKYQAIKDEADASFKANEKRVVELQFDRNQLENEKAAVAKDKVAFEVSKRELDEMSKKTQEAYQEANSLKGSLLTEVALLDAQRASIAKAERILNDRKDKLVQAEAKLVATQAEYEEKLAKLKAVVG